MKHKSRNGRVFATAISSSLSTSDYSKLKDLCSQCQFKKDDCPADDVKYSDDKKNQKIIFCKTYKEKA